MLTVPPITSLPGSPISRVSVFFWVLSVYVCMVRCLSVSWGFCLRPSPSIGARTVPNSPKLPKLLLCMALRSLYFPDRPSTGPEIVRNRAVKVSDIAR